DALDDTRDLLQDLLEQHGLLLLQLLLEVVGEPGGVAALALELLLALASGVSSAPFFSISSRSFSSSTRRPSISFCIVAFSRSSASRAATPAAERASTRCTSTYAILPAEFAAAPAGAGACARAMIGVAATTAATKPALSHTFIP